MPFTPFHMGPGMLIKTLLQQSFSLIVFGWTQILMDGQPLIVLLSGEGHLRGFTHTFIGASLIAAVAGISGKYLGDRLLIIPGEVRSGQTGPRARQLRISWPVAAISALTGAYTHVTLDGIMHGDVEPFAPFVAANPFLGLLPVMVLHHLCVLAGLLGMVGYAGVLAWKRYLQSRQARS